MRKEQRSLRPYVYNEDNEAMRLLLTFTRAYPGQTVMMLIALLFAGVADGVGVLEKVLVLCPRLP